MIHLDGGQVGIQVGQAGRQQLVEALLEATAPASAHVVKEQLERTSRRQVGKVIETADNSGEKFGPLVWLQVKLEEEGK